MDGPEKGQYERLRRAGIPVDEMPPAHRDVLAELSEDEVNTLVSLRDRLRAAAGRPEAERPDVVGVFYY